MKKTELEKTKEALEIAVDALRDAYDTGRNQIISVKLASISAILAPDPVEIETVELVRWESQNPAGYPEWTTFSDDADDWRREGRRVVELTGSFTRPKKQPVVKRVSIPAQISSSGQSFNDPAAAKPEWSHHTECHNKRGVLTFEWEEPTE